MEKEEANAKNDNNNEDHEQKETEPVNPQPISSSPPISLGKGSNGENANNEENEDLLPQNDNNNENNEEIQPKAPPKKKKKKKTTTGKKKSPTKKKKTSQNNRDSAEKIPESEPSDKPENDEINAENPSNLNEEEAIDDDQDQKSPSPTKKRKNAPTDNNNAADQPPQSLPSPPKQRLAKKIEITAQHVKTNLIDEEDIILVHSSNFTSAKSPTGGLKESLEIDSSRPPGTPKPAAALDNTHTQFFVENFADSTFSKVKDIPEIPEPDLNSENNKNGDQNNKNEVPVTSNNKQNNKQFEIQKMIQNDKREFQIILSDFFNLLNVLLVFFSSLLFGLSVYHVFLFLGSLSAGINIKFFYRLLQLFSPVSFLNQFSFWFLSETNCIISATLFQNEIRNVFSLLRNGQDVSDNLVATANLENTTNNENFVTEKKKSIMKRRISNSIFRLLQFFVNLVCLISSWFCASQEDFFVEMLSKYGMEWFLESSGNPSANSSTIVFSLVFFGFWDLLRVIACLINFMLTIVTIISILKQIQQQNLTISNFQMQQQQAQQQQQIGNNPNFNFTGGQMQSFVMQANNLGNGAL